MAESAMSGTTWDGGWEALSNLDELLFFKPDNKEVKDPALKHEMTKHEIAEEVLHKIEGLRRNNTDDWLDELLPFDDLQILTTVEEIESSKFGGCSLKYDQQLYPCHGSVVPEVYREPSPNKDLISVSCEDAATFILSKEDIICIKNESFLSLDPLQPERMKAIEYDEEKPPTESANKSPRNAAEQPESSWTDLDSVNLKTGSGGLAVVEEILRNTAQELDHWESDTTQSEVSSDGTAITDFSSKEKEEETDDPDWKPVSSNSPARRFAKRAKSYLRGGSQEEKKLRKKEQNKNAATRYRQKKKAETYEILKEEEQLKEKKAKLEETVADIQHEIKCLKAFMREFFKAKGVLVD